MKNNITRSPFLRAFGLVVMLLGFAPALVFIRAPMADGLRTLAPLALCLLCLPISRLPKAGRICALMPLSLLCGICAFWISRGDAGAARYVYITACVAAPVISLPSLFRERLYTELSIGIVATLAAWPLLRPPNVALCRAEVQRLAIMYLPLLLIYANQAQLEWEGSAQRSVQARGMKSANAALSCVVIAVVFLAASAKEIWGFIKSAMTAVLNLIMRMLANLPVKEESGGMEGGAEDMLMPPLVEEEPSIILKLLEILLFIAAFAAIAFVLVKFLKRLPKAVRALYRKIKDALKKYISSISVEGGDYVDFSEDLNAGEAGLGGTKRRKPKRRYRWEGLDNRRRVRAAYRLAVAGKARPNMTARENLLSMLAASPEAASTLAKCYDRARYSDHAISDEEAESARNAAKAARRD